MFYEQVRARHTAHHPSQPHLVLVVQSRASNSFLDCPPSGPRLPKNVPAMTRLGEMIVPAGKLFFLPRGTIIRATNICAHTSAILEHFQRELAR